MAGLALPTMLVPDSAEAQPAAKVRRIGLLAGAESTAPAYDVFRHALRELGWSEGRNVAIEFRSAEGRAERLPDLAAELLRLEVEVIVAATGPAVVAARNATRTIPIVMIDGPDPIPLGFANSLGRPGGNLTGTTFSTGPEFQAKAFGLLKEALPDVRRVAVLSNPASPSQARVLGLLQGAAPPMGLTLMPIEVRTVDALPRAFEQMTRDRAQAVFVLPDSLFSPRRAELAELCLKHRLPSMHGLRGMAVAGGLMAYAPRSIDNFRRAATYVDKILKGANAADLPIEQPTRFDLVINLKTAKALGITIPRTVLLRADEVIE
jgi:putative ABC transport system substrate-binding protein